MSGYRTGRYKILGANRDPNFLGDAVGDTSEAAQVEAAQVEAAQVEAAQIEIPATWPNPGDVAGRRVVLTGASRGLGRLLAHGFSSAGAKLTLVARTRHDLVALASELPGPSIIVVGDVSDEEVNERIAADTIAEWGGLDVWISNAGISPVVADARSVDLETWRQVLEVNLTSAFLGARAAAKVMQPGGRIVFTGSVLGERSARGLGAYGASKAGLVALAKSLALDFADEGITVNVVAPGWFDSPLDEGWKKNPKLADRVLSHTAQHRWGANTDLVGAYQFLASDASAFITGTVINVDGGYLLV